MTKTKRETKSEKLERQQRTYYPRLLKALAKAQAFHWEIRFGINSINVTNGDHVNNFLSYEPGVEDWALEYTETQLQEEQDRLDENERIRVAKQAVLDKLTPEERQLLGYR
jgi:hypothetical protein